MKNKSWPNLICPLRLCKKTTTKTSVWTNLQNMKRSHASRLWRKVPCLLLVLSRNNKEIYLKLVIYKTGLRHYMEQPSGNTMEVLSKDKIKGIIKRGRRWRSWLKHCVGVIPSIITGIIYWNNPSGHTMALESTQPLTKMSTRNISYKVKAAGA
jgi:hypothetical protein